MLKAVFEHTTPMISSVITEAVEEKNQALARDFAPVLMQALDSLLT